MLNNFPSALLGLAAVIGAVVLLFVPHGLFPTFTTVLRIIFGVGAILVVLLVALVMFFAFWKPKETGGEAGDGEAAKLLAKGRAGLLELRQHIMHIKNRRIRRLGEEIIVIMDKIIRTLREQPADIFRTRHLFDYYLPTLGEILRKYRLLEDSGVPASGAAENVLSCLEVIQTAMEKQYANLFEDDILDLTVEIDVLKQMCRRDGLLTDDAFKIESGEQSVSPGE